jgi:hypothetical protein
LCSKRETEGTIGHEMCSVSRFEVVGAHQCCPRWQCWQLAAAAVLVVVMGDEKANILKMSGRADMQVGAMERGC